MICINCMLMISIANIALWIVHYRGCEIDKLCNSVPNISIHFCISSQLQSWTGFVSLFVWSMIRWQRCLNNEKWCWIEDGTDVDAGPPSINDELRHVEGELAAVNQLNTVHDIQYIRGASGSQHSFKLMYMIMMMMMMISLTYVIHFYMPP